MIDCEIPFPIEEYKKMEEINNKAKILKSRGASVELLNYIMMEEPSTQLGRLAAMSDERLKRYSEIFDKATELYKMANIIPIKDIPFAAKAVADQIDFSEYGAPECAEEFYKKELAEKIERLNHPRGQVIFPNFRHDTRGGDIDDA